MIYVANTPLNPEIIKRTSIYKGGQSRGFLLAG